MNAINVKICNMQEASNKIESDWLKGGKCDVRTKFWSCDPKSTLNLLGFFHPFPSPPSSPLNFSIGHTFLSCSFAWRRERIDWYLLLSLNNTIWFSQFNISMTISRERCFWWMIDWYKIKSSSLMMLTYLAVVAFLLKERVSKYSN